MSRVYRNALARFLGLCLVTASGAVASAQSPGATQATPSLTEARAGFRTRQVPSDFLAFGPAAKPPPGGPRLVRYPSPAGKLVAYLSPDPGDGKRHPAVVWAQPGFYGLDQSAWSGEHPARAFAGAGMVMFYPSWRGQHDNPGRFELLYGEVDDAVAAIEYVRRLPYVDPERVYLAGYDTGATLALLAAESTAAVRAVFAFGGCLDYEACLAGEGPHGDEPFPVDDPREVRLRSPIHHVAALAVPTFHFDGSASPYVFDAQRMRESARAAGAPFHTFTIPGGDASHAVEPIVGMLSGKLASDTGPAFDVAITQSDVDGAFEAHLGQLASGARTATITEWESLLGQAVIDNRMSRALRLGPVAIAAFPERPLLHYWYGMALSLTRQDPQAVEALERARSLAPDDIDILSALIELYWAMDRWDRARQLIAHATQVDPAHEGVAEVRDAVETADRIAAGKRRVPEQGSAAAVAHAFLEAFEHGKPEEALERFVSPETWLHARRDLATGAGGDAEDQPSRAKNREFIAGAVKGMRASAQRQRFTYRGFEVDAASTTAADGTVTVSADLFMTKAADSQSIARLRAALEDPNLRTLYDSRDLAVIEGLEGPDREAFFQRIASQPTALHQQILFKMSTGADRTWQILDIGFDSLWLSEAMPLLASSVQDELKKPETSLAFLVGQLFGSLVILGLFLGAVVAFWRILGAFWRGLRKRLRRPQR